MKSRIKYVVPDIDFLCSDFAGSLTGVDLPALVKKVIEEEKSLGGVNG